MGEIVKVLLGVVLNLSESLTFEYDVYLCLFFL